MPRLLPSTRISPHGLIANWIVPVFGAGATGFVDGVDTLAGAARSSADGTLPRAADVAEAGSELVATASVAALGGALDSALRDSVVRAGG